MNLEYKSKMKWLDSIFIQTGNISTLKRTDNSETIAARFNDFYSTNDLSSFFMAKYGEHLQSLSKTDEQYFPLVIPFKRYLNKVYETKTI